MTAAVSVRHATLTLNKREQWYEDIRPSVGGSDFNPLAASGEPLGTFILRRTQQM